MRSFECDGASLRRPGRVVLVAAGVMLPPLLGFTLVASGAGQIARSAVGIVAVLEAFSLLAIALALPRVIWGAGKPRSTRVAVDARGLLLDGRLAMRRRDVSSVSLASESEPAARSQVVIAGAHHLSTIVLDLHDVDRARALAVALDADVSLPSYLVESERLVPGRRWRRALGRATFVVPGFAAAAFLIGHYVRAIVPVGYLPLAIAFFFALLRNEAPTRVVFGADGIALRLGLDAALVRFIPFAAMASVTSNPRGAEVELTSGERLELAVAGSDPSTDTQAAALARALEAAHRELADAPRDQAVEERLRRAERSTRDWFDELGELRLRVVQGYRDLALGEDRLLAVVESPQAASSARAAAAMVVAPMLDDDGRARVRAAADRTATPGLRDVIEATLREADDQELQALLEAHRIR